MDQHRFGFLRSFLFLVPQYGILGIFGAGLSVLVSSVVSFAPSIIWCNSCHHVFGFRCFLSLAFGLVAGFILLWIAVVRVSPKMVVLISVSFTLAVGFGLKINPVGEILTVKGRPHAQSANL